MVYDFLQAVFAYVAAHAAVIAALMAFVQIFKTAIKPKPYYKSWMGLAIDLVLSAAFALPKTFVAFSVFDYSVAFVAMASVSTGLYKLVSEMLSKAE